MARLEASGTGERTVWCAGLPRFGVRMRAAGATETFVVKYRGADGRRREMTLGDWPALSVDDVHRLTRRHLGDVERGLDPATDRQAERATPTMADLAAYLKAAPGI